MKLGRKNIRFAALIAAAVVGVGITAAAIPTVRLAVLLALAKDTTAELKAYERELDVVLGYARLRNTFFEALILAGRSTDVVQYYSKLDEQQAGEAETLRVVLEALVRSGRHDRAEQLFTRNKAKLQGQTYELALTTLARAYLQRKRCLDGLRMLEAHEPAAPSPRLALHHARLEIECRPVRR